MPSKEKTILISPNGDICFVYEDGHPGLDLGNARMERVSQVTWEEKTQLWAVTLLLGPNKGQTITDDSWKDRAAAIQWEIDYFNKNLDLLI